MTATAPPRPRSILLTVACAFAAAAALQTFVLNAAQLLSRAGVGPKTGTAVAAAAALPGWALGTNVALSWLEMALLVVLWRGRRLALVVYGAVVLAHNVAMLVAGHWWPGLVVMPVLVGAAAAWTWSRLR